MPKRVQRAALIRYWCSDFRRAAHLAPSACPAERQWGAPQKKSPARAQCTYFQLLPSHRQPHSANRKGYRHLQGQLALFGCIDQYALGRFTKATGRRRHHPKLGNERYDVQNERLLPSLDSTLTEPPRSLHRIARHTPTRYRSKAARRGELQGKCRLSPHQRIRAPSGR